MVQLKLGNQTNNRFIVIVLLLLFFFVAAKIKSLRLLNDVSYAYFGVFYRVTTAQAETFYSKKKKGLRQRTLFDGT